MNEIKSFIESVGLPISICIACGYGFVQMTSKMFSKLLEDAKEDKKMLKDELEYNRRVGTELLDTNKLLAQDLTGKVDNLSNKIDDFIETNKNK